MSGPLPVPAVEFNPDTCPWCGDTGFDLNGLAHHVWSRCEVVYKLAEANIADIQRFHERNLERFKEQQS